MLNHLTYDIKLWRLQRKKRHFDNRLESEIEKARRHGKSKEDLLGMRLSKTQESLEHYDAIVQLQNDYLVREAQAYLIPLPDGGPEDQGWEQSSITGKWRLIPPEQVKLRSAIRAEKRERWESISRWIPILSAMSGLLGVLVAVLALLKK